ncbi:MAG: hypothetical protein VKM92_02145 [Cyanobacteriota bacterium]|nr:hypothetical protein [Cyanobacteriota bacterium]
MRRPQNPAWILALAGGASGVVLTLAVLLIVGRRSVQAYDCGVNAAGVQLIVQSGPDYLLAASDPAAAPNSYLVSMEPGDPRFLPGRWLLPGSTTLAASGSGFRLKTSVADVAGQLSFDTARAQLSQSSGGAKPEATSCRRLAALPEAVNRFNGVPLDYLLLRPLALGFLNPDLSDLHTRVALARVLLARRGSDYSVYKLLALVPRDQLQTGDLDGLEGARRRLQAELSSNVSVWVYGGRANPGWFFDGEQAEASRHAEQWCRGQSEGVIADRLRDGYQVIQSTPQSRSSGTQRALYPDGRFAGYVDWTANCEGTQTTLQRDGDLSRLP